MDAQVLPLSSGLNFAEKSSCSEYRWDHGDEGKRFEFMFSPFLKLLCQHDYRKPGSFRKISEEFKCWLHLHQCETVKKSGGCFWLASRCLECIEFRSVCVCKASTVCLSTKVESDGSYWSCSCSISSNVANLQRWWVSRSNRLRGKFFFVLACCPKFSNFSP